MEGGFQKSLQLFVVNGYYVFEDDVCVDLSGVLGGLTMPASLFQSSLLWLGAPLCQRLLNVQRSMRVVERRRAFKQSIFGEPSSKASLESLQAKRL